MKRAYLAWAAVFGLPGLSLLALAAVAGELRVMTPALVQLLGTACVLVWAAWYARDDES